jgi:PIN domain nuclease of toxin-antitoxin system
MLTSDLSASDRLVLDTHIWVWASGESGGPAQITPAALPPIEAAAHARRLFVSATSVWEIALKAQRGRALIASDLDSWVREQRQYPGVRVLGIDFRLAITATRLPTWVRKCDGQEHRDPSDRFIVATARRLNAVLITCDEEILDYADQGNLRGYDARTLSPLSHGVDATPVLYSGRRVRAWPARRGTGRSPSMHRRWRTWCGPSAAPTTRSR